MPRQDVGNLETCGKGYKRFEVVCFEITCLGFLFLQMPLIRYWFCIVLVAIGFVAWQSRKPKSSASSTITRKFFHLLALAVYIPGIIHEPYLMHLGSSVAVAAFVFIEVGFNLITTMTTYCATITHISFHFVLVHSIVQNRAFW